MTTCDYKNFDGVKLPTECHLLKEKIEHFEVRNEDVWVTSNAKSGITWCQEMVWLIGNDLDYDGAQHLLDLRFPFIEFNGFIKEIIRFNKKHNLMDHQDLIPPDFLKLIVNTEGTRYIKTHLPWEFLPRQIVDGIKTPKIIHVMRNPKQVVPSHYNHSALLFPNFIGNLEEFVDFYIRGELTAILQTVLSYWKQRHLSNLLILTYEEMHSDVEAVIGRVSSFLGKSYNEEQVKKLAHHLSFSEMKKNPAVNAQTVLQDENRQFIRKGETESYKQELTSEMINKLDEWIAENINGTGIPYENC